MKEPVRIVPPQPLQNGKLSTAAATKLYCGNQELLNVVGVDIRLRPDDMVTAEITVLPQVEEVWALPWMSEEMLHHAAERYGYTLTKKEAADETDC